MYLLCAKYFIQICLILIIILWVGTIIQSHFRVDWNLKGLSDLPKARKTTRMCTQKVWLQSPGSKPSYCISTLGLEVTSMRLEECFYPPPSPLNHTYHTLHRRPCVLCPILLNPETLECFQDLSLASFLLTLKHWPLTLLNMNPIEDSITLWTMSAEKCT